MATSLVGGAAIGAVFGELLKAVLDMKDRAVMFKPTLAYLSSILEEIAPVIKEIEQHNKDLGRPKEELERLIKEMEEGTKLVCECSKIHKLNYFKRARYQDQLEALVDSLVRFFNIDMLAQTARDTKETLLKVRSIDRKLMKLSCAIRMEETTVLSSDSGSVPVYVSELEIHHSRATQPAENAAGTNSGEQVVVRHISQETTSSSWDSDSVSIDVSESESLHSTATQPAEIENEAETNFIEQLMEPITNLTQEVGQVLEKDQIMNKFHEVTARLEQTLGGISYDKLDISDDVKKQLKGSSSDSSSVLVDMSELEIHQSKATQLAEIAMGTNSAEQVVLRHISQKTSSSWDSDPVSVDVSESKTLHATALQFAEIENASETNSIEQVLEPVTSLTQEFGQVLKRDLIMNRFHEVTARLEQALGEISYDKLDKSNEVKKKVELFLAQFRIARERVDAPNVEFYDGLLSLFNNINDVATDPTILRRLAENLQLIGIVDLIEESLALHEMVAASGGDPGAGVEKILMLLNKIKYYVQTENLDVDDNVEGKGLSSSCCRQGTNEKNHQPPVIPDDFRCPISQELMKDPVIVSTGETYERSCIEKWLEAGNVTCPKTQKALSSAVLTPNFALRSLIAQWCQANGIEPPKQPSSSQPVEQSEIENLLAKLTFGNLEDQRSAAGEIRLLTKCNADNRVTLAEAGAIPPLVDLLSSLDSRIQEHAVTALLNLSICENNKGSIISSGAVPGIVHVLKKGSMEARENAAATIFNLSFTDENKVTIGSSGAMPPLVKLLREGTQRGKKDAATALFNLCICEGNKRRAVRADIVPILMLLLTDLGGGVVDEALGILVLLASHHQGRAAIRAAKAMPALVEVIRNGSPRNKENAAAGLVHICWGDQQYLAQALELGVMGPLLELAQDGTDRGKRKAVQLLKMIEDVGANYF